MFLLSERMTMKESIQNQGVLNNTTGSFGVLHQTLHVVVAQRACKFSWNTQLLFVKHIELPSIWHIQHVSWFPMVYSDSEHKGSLYL